MSSLQEQLRQAQKMEAIGLLAGGIAHDFNNILSVILLHVDSLLESLEKESHIKAPEAICIKEAAERAAQLTRQLLAFSRRQVLEPKIVSLNSIVTDLERMLRRVIGEDIELLTRLDPMLKTIKVDPGQMEQVIMNLAVNARDAMPEGGKLAIDTLNMEINSNSIGSESDIRPGNYVMLSITDTGCGMDPQTVGRVFEPFFTTKDNGKGTGLGLSTVFGIIKQSGGEITVTSEIAKGTAFKILLPVHVGTPEKLPVQESASQKLQGTETILVVEDDPHLRRVTCDLLRRYGYGVLEAGNGAEALTFFKDDSTQIDLVMTDVIMPEITGPELIKRLSLLRENRPFKVLFLSGYSAGKLSKFGFSDKSTFFIEKPYAVKTLLRKIRGILAPH